jgi:hypothetical protein
MVDGNFSDFFIFIHSHGNPILHLTLEGYPRGNRPCTFPGCQLITNYEIYNFITWLSGNLDSTPKVKDDV